MRLWTMLLASGCATEAGIQERWDAFLAENSACAVDEDCVVVYPECPLGCWATVSADAEAEAKELSERLVSRYERGGRACAYGCISAGDPSCVDGACLLSPHPTATE